MYGAMAYILSELPKHTIEILGGNLKNINSMEFKVVQSWAKARTLHVGWVNTIDVPEEWELHDFDYADQRLEDGLEDYYNAENPFVLQDQLLQSTTLHPQNEPFPQNNQEHQEL